MPSNSARGSQRKAFKFLAAPGMYLVYKYTQYKRQQQECAKKKATEKELQSLNQKIDKLLTKIDDNDSISASTHTEDEECVVCLCAKATMQTFPCGHKVVCRKCFVRTIQIAVNQRCLPLRCVVCRTKILKLKQTRDASPLTPPPSRNHIKLPWQRERSVSPSVRRAHHPGSGSSQARPQHRPCPSSKPFATRAMQSLLIHPQPSTHPRQAFASDDSTLRNECQVQPKIQTVKKQVRFANPVANDSPIHVGACFDSEATMSPSKASCMLANSHQFITSSDHVSADMKRDMEMFSHKTILRNTAETRIPAVCNYAYDSPCLSKSSSDQSCFISPKYNTALSASPKRVIRDV